MAGECPTRRTSPWRVALRPARLPGAVRNLPCAGSGIGVAGDAGHRRVAAVWNGRCGRDGESAGRRDWAGLRIRAQPEWAIPASDAVLGPEPGRIGSDRVDGMLPNVAGGKMGEFNVRFGQPSSLSNRSVNNLPPFLDLEPNGDDGILAEVTQRGVAPKVIYTNTSSEYWGGHGALAHMTPDGKADVQLPTMCGRGCSAGRSTRRPTFRFRTPTRTPGREAPRR